MIENVKGNTSVCFIHLASPREVGLAIGAGGSHLKKVQQATGVTLLSFHGYTLRIEGTKLQTNRAAALIRAKVARGNRRVKRRYNPCRNRGVLTSWRENLEKENWHAKQKLKKKRDRRNVKARSKKFRRSRKNIQHVAMRRYTRTCAQTSLFSLC